ncbi:type II toxin-antitoxin system RelE/ParE family toxin [Pseudidiomarina salilacus]|uniref:type II toxin-antitoxin system RelE/ParE family toxin n=1 Tax=Pseudidiomarina salilacus TaxID=3384452 RepID=UPI0039851E07
MSIKLVYTDEAIADLQRVRAFIAEHDPQAAKRIAASLIERLKLLQHFPELGIAVPHAPDPRTVRDMMFGRYCVRYSIHVEVVIVLRIWHTLEQR